MQLTKELKTDKCALLDKICLYNFTIVSIENVECLQEEGILTVKEKQSKYAVLRTGEYFSSIHIGKTEYFDNFFFGVWKNEVYGSMEMSVPDDGFHNLNCLTAEQYIQRIGHASCFLWETYGIIVDYSNVKYKSMEINRTIVLDYAFQAYHRPIALLMYLLPSKLRLMEADFSEPDIHPARVNNYDRRISTYTKSSGKKGMSVKVYDKKSHLSLCFGITTHQNYLRYEITLKSSTKIKKAFDSNDVYMITDKDLNRYFEHFIFKNVVAPYYRHCVKRDIALRKILKEYYEPCSKTWTRDTLGAIREIELKNGVPLMLEIDELKTQIQYLKIKTKQQRYALKERFDQLCKDQNSVFKQDDGKKCSEIYNKLLI